MPTTSTKTIRPLQAQLNNRDQPDVLPVGACRSRTYFSTVDGKLARAHGFRRFLDQTPYCNQDLHDQLLTLQVYYSDTTPATDGADAVEEYPSDKCGAVLYTRSNGVEHVTLLKEIQTEFGTRYLLAGTQSRMYLLNETTGNWRLLGDGFGGETNEALAVRWSTAVLKDRLIATNNVDRVQYWQMDDPVKGCAMRALQAVPELELVQYYKARIVMEYMGYIVLMNVHSGGSPLPGLVVWSERNLPLAYDPATNQFLNPDAQKEQELSGHVILNAVEFNGVLAIFTDKGIWSVSLSGDALAPFNFGEMYKQKDGNYKCLAFPNTLVTTGEVVFWVGRDQIYAMSGGISGPETVEWIKNASKTLFDEINKQCCDSHVAAFNPITEEIWISYATGTSCVPNKTLVLNLRYQTAYYRPEGYTAFTMFRSDSRITMRDFLWQNGVCTPSGLATEFIKEGLPCATVDDDLAPTKIYTDLSVTIADPDTPGEPLVVEDYDAAEPSADSLCAILGDQKASDFCHECNEEQLFVGAYAVDKCLKDIGPAAYSLEVCAAAGQSGERSGFSAPTPDLDDNAYAQLGYDSEIVFGPISLGDTEREVNIQRLTLFFHAEPSLLPCAVGLTVGLASVPLDSNQSDCPIVWHDPEYRVLECVNEQGPEDYKSNNERPILTLDWPLLRTARYLYLKMTVVGLSVAGDAESAKVLAVGGASDFYSMELKYQERKW